MVTVKIKFLMKFGQKLDNIILWLILIDFCRKCICVLRKNWIKIWILSNLRNIELRKLNFIKTKSMSCTIWWIKWNELKRLGWNNSLNYECFFQFGCNLTKCCRILLVIFWCEVRNVYEDNCDQGVSFRTFSLKLSGDNC